MHGLRICPDLDTTLYALSGRQDVARGWGLRDESFRCMEALRGLGHDVWFNLGDRDLATHLLRTGLLRDGIGLADVTRRLAAAMGVAVRVLPMTEDEVTTTLATREHGELHYEEYLVAHDARPLVHSVRYDGLDRAEPAPRLLEAIAEADLIVLAPSSPMASMGPILGLRGVRAALAETGAPIVAVSPIVSRVPIRDAGERRRAASRAALLRAAGVPATAAGVAGIYRDLCRRYVLDTADAVEADEVRALGIEAIVVPTLLHCGAPAGDLVEAVLATRAY
jgi:LPPG:FO 2-phospho-L-lactate transferase